MLTVFRKMFARVAVVDQRIDVAIRDCKNATASAAIAPVWSTLGDELFTAKTVRAVAALAGNNFDGGFVDEFHA